MSVLTTVSLGACSIASAFAGEFLTAAVYVLAACLLIGLERVEKAIAAIAGEKP